MSEVERCLRRQIMHADLKCLGAAEVMLVRRDAQLGSRPRAALTRDDYSTTLRLKWAKGQAIKVNGGSLSKFHHSHDMGGRTWRPRVCHKNCT